MSESKANKQTNTVHARRAVAYIVLILLSFLCLIWFYVLFINATRSNNQLKTGFTPLPSTYLVRNMTNLFKGSTPVVRGMLNSLIIAACSATLCVYFSTMTAYAIHAYDFKGKKAIFSFILAIMMIPTQVSALGFIRLMGRMLDFIPTVQNSDLSAIDFINLPKEERKETASLWLQDSPTYYRIERDNQIWGYCSSQDKDAFYQDLLDYMDFKVTKLCGGRYNNGKEER